jgi:hypothetical protein
VVEVFLVEIDHVQYEIGLLLEGADLLAKLSDPNSVEMAMAAIEVPSAMNRLGLPGFEILVF